MANPAVPRIAPARPLSATPVLARDAPLALRSDPLSRLRSVDFRSPERDFWADEAALWDRFMASWAGIDEAAWSLPGAAPSDAGGPDWSLLDHVGHVADWQELALDYVARAASGGPWPSDEDFEGGDFDRFNEARRAPWDRLAPAEIRRRLEAGHDRLVALARTISLDTVRTDDAWGWVHMVLHGHTLDHLGVIEPWADGLRDRQADGDPLGPDPRVGSGDERADAAAFRAADSALFAQLDDLLATIPEAAWTAGEVTDGWTIRDHVAHLADWFEEGARVVSAYQSTGAWAGDPPEGIDAWNARAVARSANATRDDVLQRYREGRSRLQALVATLPQAAVRDPLGWDWVYDCLHGHARKHLARLGPFAAGLRASNE